MWKNYYGNPVGPIGSIGTIDFGRRGLGGGIFAFIIGISAFFLESLSFYVLQLALKEWKYYFTL